MPGPRNMHAVRNVSSILSRLLFGVLLRLKNSEAVYPACRKRRLLGTYQLQSDC